MNAFTGTAPLMRLILRRDRFVLPAWVLALAIIPVGYGSSFAGLFTTDAARQAYYEGTLHSPAQLALLGPIFDSTLGALTAWRSGFMFVLIGLASLFTVIRHTRSEEEAGRRELLGATVIGRQAPLAAALAVTCAANLVLGAVAAVGLVGLDLPVAGSVALGLALASVGCVFTAVGGVVAQVTEGARSARGLGVAVLAGAFVLRAAGDAGGVNGSLSWLSWLSPVGWAQQIRPFAGERWWLLGFTVVAGIGLSYAGFALSGRRDLGAGLLPTRLGPETARPSLRSPVALAWRLHRGVLLSWVVGFAVGGLVLGAIAQTIGEQFNGSQQLLDLLQRLGSRSGIVDAYLATVMSIVGLAASGYAISATLRLRAEEEALRAEPVLATSVGRLAWAGSHLVFGLLGPAVLLVTAGLWAGLAHGVGSGDLPRELPRVLAAALVQLPAVWVLAGLATALFGLAPRLTYLTWAALGTFLLLGQVGGLLQLDQRALDLSPFTHLPRVPGGDIPVTPVAWLVLVAMALTAAGLAGLRRRDLAS